MYKNDTIYNRLMVRLFVGFEQVFHFLLYCGLSLSAMIVILLSFESWGIFYASIITFSSIICTAIFWKIQSHFVRSFRSSLLLGLLMLLAYPTWVLVGIKAHEVPTYLIIPPITVGVFALISGSLFAWQSWIRVNFVTSKSLSTKDIVKRLSNLPEEIHTNQKVLDAFASMARLSWLFASNEFSLVIRTVGSSIETLLKEVYPEHLKEIYRKKHQNKEPGVVTMAKELKIDVSYEKLGSKNKQSLNIPDFWCNVRSKYAHSTGLEKVGIKQLFIFNVLKEPSEETAEMSIGLLNEFLQAYSEYCHKS
jgi:hypothetical protein